MSTKFIENSSSSMQASQGSDSKSERSEKRIKLGILIWTAVYSALPPCPAWWERIPNWYPSNNGALHSTIPWSSKLVTKETAKKKSSRCFHKATSPCGDNHDPKQSHSLRRLMCKYQYQGLPKISEGQDTVSAQTLNLFNTVLDTDFVEPYRLMISCVTVCRASESEDTSRNINKDKEMLTVA
jgi:hypothetical protein